MLMLSVIFLPFGVTERLSFLSNSAISLMFNSGAKMMVICFLQVLIAKILGAYLTNLGASPFANLSTCVQMTVMCVFFAYVTKKIPDLVSSFLNGSPALSGGGMIQQAKESFRQVGTVVAGVGTATGAVAGASAAASGAAASGEGASGKLAKQMSKLGTPGRAAAHLVNTAGFLARAGAQNALAQNPLTQGYAQGMKAVVGGDGGLQNSNVGFMQGVRRLAGMETDKPAPESTDSIASIAANNGKRPSSKENADGDNGGSEQGNARIRISNLKDLQNMTQEQRQQAISSMSNQSLQDLAKRVDAKDTTSLTREQRQQFENFKDQKDVDSMTKEQRQTLNSIFEEIGKPPRK